MRVILKVTDLCKTFTLHRLNQRKIIGCQNINFTVQQGQFIGITGKSGAGKTTVLKCIYRTYLPSSGSIVFNSALQGEIDLAQSDVQQIITVRRQEIGYIAQFLRVLPQMTALDLVVETLLAKGDHQEQAVQQARAMLRHFQIPAKLWDAYPHTFSGGEKLRLNLAQAMIKRPRLLLLDEPTAALDEQSKAPVQEMIIELKKSGTTMVGIFHDLAFMKDVVDSNYQISQGCFKEVGIA
ncbi:MAG: ATP-binding cassette domain-containing protein [Desulfotomaculum sp.]|nr:ATP-binding cassette domain-containing protein [Desulfotomaculum sp.]MCL0081075.1 ATP-binding cassette domain-containing protein [Peptococcaceae bacterium]